MIQFQSSRRMDNINDDTAEDECRSSSRSRSAETFEERKRNGTRYNSSENSTRINMIVARGENLRTLKMFMNDWFPDVAAVEA